MSIDPIDVRRLPTDPGPDPRILRAGTPPPRSAGRRCCTRCGAPHLGRILHSGLCRACRSSEPRRAPPRSDTPAAAAPPRRRATGTHAGERLQDTLRRMRDQLARQLAAIDRCLAAMDAGA